MRVFVYEYAYEQPAEADVPASVRREGRAMFEAVVEDFARIDGVEVVTLPPNVDEESAFKSAVRAAEWNLIIAPEFNGILETRCRWVEEAGGLLLGCPTSVMRHLSDKVELARLLRTWNVPTPLWWLASLHDARGHGSWPCVLKPRLGAGSVGVQLLQQGDYIDPDDAYLVQVWHAGTPASIAYLHGQTGFQPLPPAQQILGGAGFEYQGGVLPLSASLTKRAIALTRLLMERIRELGYQRGWCGVDMVFGEANDGSEDVVIEVNCRLTTSYIGLRVLAIDNLAEVMLRLAEGEEVGPVRWRDGLVRFDAIGRVDYDT